MTDTTKTPRLKLPYLDPSQAQPEVKINEAWDILDANSGASDTRSDSSDTSSDNSVSITVEDRSDSPKVTIDNVTTLRFVGAHVAAESGGVAQITIPSAHSDNSISLTVEDRADSPATIVDGVTTLRFSGARVLSESGGVALVEIPALLTVEDLADSPATIIEKVTTLRFVGAAIAAETNGVAQVTVADGASQVGAEWVSMGAGALSLPTNTVIKVAKSAGSIRDVTVYTTGGTGSCTIRVWKCAKGAVPTISNDITGGANVVISGGTYHDDSTLAGWTPSVAIGDVFLFTLASVSGFTNVTIVARIK